ncbi:MAG: glycosyltransferase family 4 protein [Gammaproteobacteria bacterium]|nr:glycosyltransferase family 4 protein [Gammaproteobacteria bacterium]
MKNILLVVRWPVGGIRTYLKYVFSGPEFDNYRIRVVAPDVAGFGAQFGTVFATDRFEYVPCEDSPKDLLRVTWRELRRTKFDLINAQGFTSAIAALLPSVVQCANVPRVLTVHDVLHEVQFNGWKGRVKRWLMAQVFKRYHCIIPVSNDCRDNMVSFLPEVIETRINTILNGVSVERLATSKPLGLRGQLGIDDHTLLVGFMGRFMAQKGFRYLVDAVEKLIGEASLRRRPLVLCFGIGGFYREEMADIKARGLSEHFKLFDHIEDVGAAMKALDVVVMPSLWEACPLLPMEVLICGTPLIASNCIGLREVVADTPAWVVPQADGEALANALREVARDSRRAVFENYAPKAAQRFDVTTTRSGLAALYTELLQERGR